MAPEALRILDEAGLRTLLVYSGIQGAQERALVGTPRDTYRHWLGSIEPRAEEAGYLTAKALIDKGREARAFGPDGKLHLLAIAADRATPTSIRRSEGMRKAVEEAGDAVLDQEVFGAFSREKATEQSAWLFQRFPHARDSCGRQTTRWPSVPWHRGKRVAGSPVTTPGSAASTPRARP
ncbi:hypothetical protein [Thauera humireducens]|uniref:hypothetical protein n=1 Tax=Thauera humireducens TaxID=1134435 RepID=UPI00311DA776